MATEILPDRAPPIEHSGPVAWMRDHLFHSPYQVILTLIGLFILAYFVVGIVNFAILEAVFTGDNREACLDSHGACWPYVYKYFHQFIYGAYPIDQRWRPDSVALVGIIGLIGLVFSSKYRWGASALIVFLVALAVFFRDSSLIVLISAISAAVLFEAVAFSKVRLGGALLMLIAFPLFAFIMLTGGNFDYIGYAQLNVFGMEAGPYLFWLQYFVTACVMVLLISGLNFASGGKTLRTALGAIIAFSAIALVLFFLSIDFALEPVRTHYWGGLLVTLVIAVTGIASSLPIGIVLALGRRSEMPVIRLICIIFIEFWRGVPLITVLFMADVMIPLFLPQGVSFDGLLRVLVGVTLFSSAYMAEVVRGGLQAIGRGQYEGAQALGLTYGQMTRMIILPQALKLVIPGIVNTFIGLFKDTTLVSIVGLFDLLGVTQRSFTDPTWSVPTQADTGYLVVAAIFFIFCFGMSRYSIYMEHKLHTGHKR